MNLEQYIASGILEQYALGLLTEPEMRQVESMATQHPEVRAELDAIRESLVSYAAEHQKTPPVDLKQRVLNAVAGKPVLPRETAKPTAAATPRTDTAAPRRTATKPTTATNKSGTGGLLGWGIAGLLALGLAALGFMWMNASNDRDRLQTELDAQNAALASTQSNCQTIESELNTVRAELNFWKNANSVPLTYIRGRSKEPLAIVYWNNETESAQIKPTANLQDLPEGRVYQLWAAVGSDLISLGTFTDDENTLQQAQYVANVEAFNVTVEPAGGSETPTLRTLFANAKV